MSDYAETITKDLMNGDEITGQFESAYAVLMEHYEAYDCPHPDPGKSPYLCRKPHGPDFSPDTRSGICSRSRFPWTKGRKADWL